MNLLASRNRITDVQNKLMVTKGGTNWWWDELGDWD